MPDLQDLIIRTIAAREELNKAWSPEARAAAAEARRNKTDRRQVSARKTKIIATTLIGGPMAGYMYARGTRQHD